MRIQLSVGTLVAVGLLALQTPAWGQWVNRNVSSGTFGSRTLGGGTSFGGQSFGSQSFGRGAFTGGMSSNPMGNSMGSIGSAPPGSSTIGQQPGQFVGTSADQMRGFFSQLGAGQNTTGRRQSGLGNRGRRSSNQPSGRGGRGGPAAGGGSETVNIRTSLRVAFDYPTTPAARTAATLAQRLEQSKQLQVSPGVEVLVRDGTAILRGVVATNRDRLLAGQLARLEAGVWRVDNQLVVAQGPAGPQMPAPAKPAPVQTPAAPPGPAAE